jgi:GTP-binding protein Era
VQTTRNVIRAILHEPRGQLVFLDTPGVHHAEGELGRFMNKSARSAVSGVDHILLILDRSVRPTQIDEGWFRRLAHEEHSPFFVLNKSDVNQSYEADYQSLWEKIATEKEATCQPRWMSIAAREGRGVDLLVDQLFLQTPEGPPLFSEEVLTDYPRKLNIADVVREKFVRRLHQELPHAVAVWVDHIHEKEDRWQIEASVLVERHSQKGILIGEKGRLIKRVKKEAQEELSEMYPLKVALTLTVKVEKNWRKNYWILQKLGYV